MICVFKDLVQKKIRSGVGKDASMGMELLPTFTIKFNQMQVNIHGSYG